MEEHNEVEMQVAQPAEVKITDPRIGLLMAIQRNVFFDAVLSSMAYTLMEEAFTKCQEIRDYPYADIDMGTVKSEDVKDYSIITMPVTDEPISMDEMLGSTDVVVDIIVGAIKAFLYRDSPIGVRCVAGTLRIHLVPENETGKLDIHITAVKHQVKE